MTRKRCQSTAALPLMLETRPPDGWRPADPPDLSAFSTIRLDWETTGVRWWEPGGARPVGVSVRAGGVSTYLPFAHRGGGNLDEAVVQRWARRELRGKRIVNINTKFEIHVAREWGVDLAAQGNTFGDVAHYAALLDDKRRTFSLEAVARDFLPDAPEYRKATLPVPPERIHELPAWIAEPYGNQDTFLVDAIAEKQGPMLGALDLVRVRKLEDAVIPVAAEMERNGAPLDMDKLERWVKESEQQLLRAIYAIHRLTGVGVEPNKDDTVAKLFAKLNLPPSIHPEDGRESYAVPALKETLAGRDARYEDEQARIALTDTARQALTALVKAKQLASLRSKFLLKYWQGHSNGVLRYALHQLRGDDQGTISGRFSSTMVDKSRKEGANIQQVMSVGAQKKALGDEFIVRELVVAPPGRRYYVSDAKQIEYRVFADIAKVRRLLDAYAKDPETDYHDLVQRFLAPLVPDLDRKQTKNTNFALIFGASDRKISVMNNMSEERTDEFLAIYRREFPEVPVVIQEFMDRASRDGFITTKLGRRTTFARRRWNRMTRQWVKLSEGDDRYHKAINAAVQGTAADYMKAKLVELYEARHDLGLTMRFTVHDEFDGDVPDDEAGRRVDALLNTQTLGSQVPIFWDGGTGANWREAKGE